jgi:branched-chain amino acid transport system ATP-binding protein
MLLMARAILPEAKLMLIDEISEGLQPTMVAALVDVLKAEHRRRPVAMLLVEQNVPFAFSLADRFAVLKRGEIVAQGSVSDQNARAVVEDHLRV